MNGRGCNRGRLGALWQSLYDGAVVVEPAEPDYIVQDTFAAADGALAGHAPDIGPADKVWTAATLTSDSGSLVISGNKVIVSSVNTSSTRYVDAGVSNGTVAADCTPIAGASFETVGIAYRLVPGSPATLYLARLNTNSGKVELYEYVSSNFTLRASAVVTLVGGTSYLLEVVLSGNDHAVQLDGVEQCTYSSSVKATATCHGIRIGGNGASPSGRASVDNFTVL